jgi:Putative peptidoglycan-binding domain-containing protein
MNQIKKLVARFMIVLCLLSVVGPDVAVVTNLPITATAQAASYSSSTTKKVQQKLNAKGYDCGTPDGCIGKDTKASIKKYQKAHGLEVTGTVNKSLLNSLHIKAATASYSNKKETTVYITRTGSKYHRDGCRYLSRSKIAVKLSEAKREGYTPCSICNP